MSNIEWTDETWNPVVGCTRVSAGCDHCYAVAMTHRLGAMAEKDIREKGPEGAGRKGVYRGLTVLNKRGGRHFNGVVRCVEEALDIPLRWKKPRTIFVNSMSDLFHEKVPFEFIDRVFAVMALTPQHTYQILTKRPERMAEYFATTRTDLMGEGIGLGEWRDEEYRPGREDAVMEAVFDDHEDETYPDHAWWIRKGRGGLAGYLLDWPLPNVWLGTSCEDQAAADARIPHLLRTPAAVRFLSCEPLLGEVDLSDWLFCERCEGDHPWGQGAIDDPLSSAAGGRPWRECRCSELHWVIAGGESGAGARPCDIAWIRSIVKQCRDAGVPVFVKQLGARPVNPTGGCSIECGCGLHHGFIDKKGGDMREWPEGLRVREYPQAAGIGRHGSGEAGS